MSYSRGRLVRSTPVAALLLATLTCSPVPGVAAGAQARTRPGPPALLVGDFEDDYGNRFAIGAAEWLQRPEGRYLVHRWAPEEQYLIARAGADEGYGSGDWMRIDWMSFDRQYPWTWGFCISAWEADTLQSAEQAPLVDRTSPRTGCNGFPFSRMRRVAPTDGPPDAATLAIFDYDRARPLQIRQHATREGEGFRVVDIEYASPAGGAVPTYLFVPDSAGPHAGMIALHGLPGSRESSRRLGERYAASGAVVLAITAPFARNHPDRPVLFTEQDRAEQIQLIQDLRRGVDLLLARDDVDAERIGFVGGSYGAAMGGLLAGVETRIRAYALFVGDGGLVAHFTGPEDDAAARMPEGQWLAWLAAMAPIEPSRFVGLAAPAELLFQSGREDRLVPPADAEAFAAAGSEPKEVRWYDVGHGFSEEMQRDQVRWFAEHIGIVPERD